MEDLQNDGDVSQKDDDPFASVPGTLSKLLTGFVLAVVRRYKLFAKVHISDIRIL